jgi:hypothetical protein
MLGATGQALSIGELENERKSFIASQGLRDAVRVNLDNIQTALLEANQQNIAVSETLALAEAKQQNLLQGIIILINSSGLDLYEPNSDDTTFNRWTNAKSALARLKTIENINVDPKEIDALLESSQTIDDEYYIADAKSFHIFQTQTNLKEQLDAAKTELDSFSKEKFARPELIGLFQQMAFFESVYFGSYLATMPPALLIPIVTLAMGALGSVIYLSAGVVAGEPARPMAWYVFRPMLGMVTAFAVFIFVQAGALVVNQPGQNIDPGQLNPYFIAFVSVISGLLSEQAVQRIRGVAANFFSNPGESDVAASGAPGEPKKS